MYLVARFRPCGDKKGTYSVEGRISNRSLLKITKTFEHVFAVVTIFLGIRLDGVGLDDSALYAMVAYCLGVAIMILFDVHLALNKDYKYKVIYRLERDAKEGELTEINFSIQTKMEYMELSNATNSAVTSK